MSIEIKFTVDTPINNKIVKKGESRTFSDSVAQNFIDIKRAVKAKKSTAK